MEYEFLKTLATVRGVGRVGWDGLGEFLLVEVEMGSGAGPLKMVPVSMTAEAAAELQALLRLSLLEKEGEVLPRQ